MEKISHIFNVFMLSVFGLLIAGCTENEAQKPVARLPRYIQGRKLQKATKYQKALQAYRECLRAHPSCHLAHLQSGIIYNDHVEKPLLAAYHFTSFLRKSPEDHPERELVKRWLRDIEIDYARDMIAARPEALQQKIRQAYGQVAGDGSGGSGADNRLTEREKRLAQKVKTLNTRVLELQKELAEHKTQPSDRAVGSVAEQEDEAGEAVSPSGETSSSSSSTYVVQQGDSLYEIAQEVYGDGMLWDKLLAYNKDTIESPDSLQPGDRLKVPPESTLLEVESQENDKTEE